MNYRINNTEPFSKFVNSIELINHTKKSKLVERFSDPLLNDLLKQDNLSENLNIVRREIRRSSSFQTRSIPFEATIKFELQKPKRRETSHELGKKE
jgi:hypothetical protein